MKSVMSVPAAALKVAVLAALFTSTLAVTEIQAAGKKRTYGVATSPYICTPSGFGQRARCYLRAELG
ncbi:MAG: hypothetical protein EOP22_01360 [Hyphomicrobiales bacterium]|nr:MAG: hypothetical protein EOP22_01360 [Hyphomicrobiales bacterium]